MAAKKRMCKLCGEREAALPDRNSGSSVFRKEVCRECHAERLRGDLEYIMDVEKRKRERSAQ